MRKDWENWTYLSWRREDRGNPINFIKYLKGECPDDGAGLFSVVPSDGIRGKKHELKHRNTRKNFFSVRVTEHWNRLPREAVESPSMKIFRNWLDMVLGNLLSVALVLEEGLDRLERSLSTSDFLWYYVLLHRCPCVLKVSLVQQTQWAAFLWLLQTVLRTFQNHQLEDSWR